jgi:hypothetical protein
MPKQAILSLAALASTLVLSGCHADITESIVADSNDKVTVTYFESLDSELFGAVSKVGGTDPFRLALARGEGWKVSDSATSVGGHVISYSKTASIDEMSSLNPPDGDHARADEALDGFNFSPSSVLPFHISLSKTTLKSESLKAQVLPALSTPEQVITRPGHDPDLASAVANSLQNAQVVDSLVDVHLEIKTLKKVVAANGKSMTGGGVRWDLHFARSGAFEYATKQYRAEIEPILVTVYAGTPDRNDASTPPAPSAADWSAVYASGVTYGVSPLAAWQSVGNAGTYDFARWGQIKGDTDQIYAPASGFAIGVYVAGAKIPRQVMNAALELLNNR